MPEEETRLSHLDEAGRVRMVDVSAKPATARLAVARGRVLMRAKTRDLILAGALAKGEALAAARLAGIMAAKRAWEIIPLAHPLNISHVEMELAPLEEPAGFEITAQVRCQGATGVEMEALTAVSAAALTLYDMAKAADRFMVITEITLVEKSGGASGHWTR